MCEYDWTQQEPKCFCFSGWYGADCNSETRHPEVIYEDRHKWMLPVLVVVIVLLMALLLLLGYLYLRYIRGRGSRFNFKLFAKRREQKEHNNPDRQYDEFNDNEFNE